MIDIGVALMLIADVRSDLRVKRRPAVSRVELEADTNGPGRELAVRSRCVHLIEGRRSDDSAELREDFRMVLAKVALDFGIGDQLRKVA